MKDLIFKMLKAVFESLLKVVVEAVKKINWKSIVYKSYIDFKPSLQKKVADSDSKVDDMVIKALDILADKFLKPAEKDAK